MTKTHWFWIGAVLGMAIQAIVIPTFINALVIYERPVYKWEKK